MTPVVVLLLGALWAWYLVGWLRGRTEHRNVNSISAFSKHLHVLERAAPVTSPRAAAVAPYSAGPRRNVAMTRSEAQRRRRNVLTALVGAVAALLLLAVVAGGVFVPTFIVALGALGGYLVMLGRSRAIREEQHRKVHVLHDDPWGDDAWDDEPWGDDEWADEAWDEPRAYAVDGY